jgi:hypothetical protein
VLVEYTLLKPDAYSRQSDENVISEIQIYPSKESGLEDHEDNTKNFNGLCGLWFKTTSEPYCKKDATDSCDNLSYNNLDNDEKCINCIELAKMSK